MKHLILFFIMILAAWNSYAGSNLLDLLKAGKAKYSTGYCQSFIQKANHNSLKSPQLLASTVRLKNFKYMDDYFFHYTDAPIIKSVLESSNTNRVAAQRSIIQKGGYRSIMEYQMTYSDALSNVKGVGFYIAANPFSSASYGDTQVALRFSPNTVVIDSTAKAAEINKAIADVTKNIPEFASCNAELKFSLLMNENGIDLALYSDSSEWLVLFNEDVIVESKVNPIISETSTAIMQEMAKVGLADALVEYITEMGATNSYRIPLTSFEAMLPAGSQIRGKSTLLTLAGYLKNWNDTSKITFAKLISSKKEPELSKLMSEFKVARLITDDLYFKIPLTQASDEFLSNIVSKIKRSPVLAKAWGDLYNDNMTFIFKKNQVDLNFYLGNFPTAAERAEFYRTYSAKGFSADQNQQILDHMLVNDQTYFRGLDKEAKYVVFNNYIRGAKASQMTNFVSVMERLGYDNQSSFNYILARPSAYGANGLAYLAAFVKLKRNPALVTDSLVNILISNSSFDSTEFMIYLKQNQSAFGASASKFAKSSLSVMNVSFLDTLLTPAYSNLFSGEEKDLILKRLLQDDTNGSKLVSKFINAFSYSASSLSSVLSRELNGLSGNGQSAVEVLKAIQVDSAEWSKFIDPSNNLGMKAIFMNSRVSNLKSHMISQVRVSFGSYSQEQKLAVAILMKSQSPADSDRFMSQVSYTPAMVTNNFSALMSQRSDDVNDFESLLNNPDFVRPLSLSQFESLVSKTVSFSKEIDLKSLIRSDALTFEKALSLALSLDKSNGEENLNEIADHQLSFDQLSDSQKEAVLNQYVSKFHLISPLAKASLWKRSFDLSVEKEVAFKFLNLVDKMLKPQKSEFLEYYTSSEALIKHAIARNGVSFFESVIMNDSQASVAAVLSYVEANYPVTEKYFVSMIRNYGSFRNTQNLQSEHLNQFVCKKVNKFQAFNDLISSEKDKDTKKYYKDQRKQICKR